MKIETNTVMQQVLSFSLLWTSQPALTNVLCNNVQDVSTQSYYMSGGQNGGLLETRYRWVWTLSRESLIVDYGIIQLLHNTFH